VAEEPERRVAEQDGYARDELGIRRRIRAGSVIPEHWELEQSEQPKASSEKPTRSVRKS
jgi:hypothetical protein